MHGALFAPCEFASLKMLGLCAPTRPQVGIQGAVLNYAQSKALWADKCPIFRRSDSPLTYVLVASNTTPLTR